MKGQKLTRLALVTLLGLLLMAMGAPVERSVAAPVADSVLAADAQARVAVALHSSPVMFIENAGRLSAAAQQPPLPGPAPSPQEGSTPAPIWPQMRGDPAAREARPDISARLPAHPSPPQAPPFINSSSVLAWNIQHVDAPKYFTEMGDRSLRLDSAGHPHIAYGGDHLYYAWHDGIAWHLETVDSDGWVGKYTSLALDAAGHPHISYYDRTNYALKYARWTGSGWAIETVDSRGVGGYTSLALDAAGHPHISYFDRTNGDLKYARWTGSGWAIQTVDSGGDVGEYTSLALDAAGHPHISYYDENNDDLKYARWTGSGWVIETVDSDGWVGRYTSLALDAAGHPHISYYGNGLKYARWTGSAWAIETVDSDGWVGGYTSLALDAAGQPHISYYDYTNGDLKYARQFVVSHRLYLPLVLRNR